MKSLRTFFFVISILSLHGLCYGEAENGIAPMVKTEQEALYSAIQGFVGNWWNGSDLYPDPCGWTPIQGVSCDLFDGFWYVTDLNIGPLHDNSLRCRQKVEFRPEMFELNHLKSLSFFNCFTSLHHPVTIPTYSWEKLASSLQSLEFRSNPRLNGKIPTIFSLLKKLQSLVLMENGLTGQIPPSIGNLANLKRLVLSGNRFTGQIPYSFGNLTELLILDLSRNSLSGYLPSTIGGLISLLKLDLSSNLMVGSIPREIANLKNLTLLDLRNNSFSGGLKIPLEKMDSLEELALSSNPIGGDLGKIEWRDMHKLVFLDLSNMDLTGEVPESMAEGMKQLRYLDLSNNNLSGNLSPKLETMPCVSALFVSGNNLTGELKFSDKFYEKLGRRFAAWKNPNLCFPMNYRKQVEFRLG
ncbi:hypothetical protein Nepgr_003685 [Nepenthes gracilis]|uniref:Disease resistance R13L4/SHOC-2-like LRR domain-containing protein n=1 Tax=Nepenthes gracilis TaxID=150966 RepID=A0AAD3XEA3_NEPGR|nr:hypothetical protein Nepgr_003685 [Nepenthes gracilis]